jgi:ABC-type nitrate/sulfonate/bicarbonate transport system substrate-binding protein
LASRGGESLGVKRSLVVLSAVLAAAVCCAQPAPLRVLAADAPAAPKVLLRYVTPSITAQNWPHFIADAEGFFSREGLQVELTPIDPNTLAATLIGGSTDIALAASSPLVIAIDKGADLVAVGAGADRSPYSLVASPAIKTIKDLKGKRIGAVSPFEAYTVVIKEILRKAGLDPEKDVEFVYGGGQNQRFAALLGGAVQAGLLTPPSDKKLLERGFNALAFTPDYYPYLQLSITTVRRDWARQHPDVLRRYLRSQADASKWLNDRRNRDRALQILEKATNSSPEEAAAAYDAYVVKVHDFPNNYCVMRPGMQALLKMMHDLGQTTSNPADVGKYVDDEWCPK